MTTTSGLQVSPHFVRRVSRMTTAEMRKCVEDWDRRIREGGIPDERLQAAKQQLMYLSHSIEKRIGDEPHPRTLRR